MCSPLDDFVSFLKITSVFPSTFFPFYLIFHNLHFSFHFSPLSEVAACNSFEGGVVSWHLQALLAVEVGFGWFCFAGPYPSYGSTYLPSFFGVTYVTLICLVFVLVFYYSL